MKIKHTFHKTIFFTICIQGIFLLTCVSCKKQKEPEKEYVSTSINNSDNTHKWYYFSKTGFQTIDLPQDSPSVIKNPWTEAIRISSTGTAQNLQNGEKPYGYAVVNRLGILMFDGEKIQLYEDPSIFSEKTAGNLFFIGAIPIYTLFRSSIFNTNSSETVSERPFLLQFRPDTGISYPIINYANLNLPSTADITDLQWDGQNWTCCIKNTINENKIKFSYITIKPRKNLLSISPANAKENVLVTPISRNEFREKKEHLSYDKAPERLQKLLETIPKNIPMKIECTTTGGTSPVIYTRNTDSEKDSVCASAVIADSWTMVVFTDGTIYLNGAFYNEHMVKDGKDISILLPRLPQGFAYGHFAVSGTNLYVSWEENDFYEIGKSGFIMVDLDKVLYD